MTDAVPYPPPPPVISLLEELEWRGALYQHTEGAEAALAAGQVTGYAGFDPTAPSLHVGNLVPVMGLVRLQMAGHRPIALVGGGTGLIGDPSGKSGERALADEATTAANAGKIRVQLERFLDFDGPRGALMRDNSEWLTELRAIEFMRDVGKYFTVNVMLAKDSVRSRMETGISYTEFSYMLLQAYDFLEMHRRDGVTLQLGGSDQWGNMTAGVDLIRRVTGHEAHVVTFPLLLTGGGAKFGKSESGAVYLDAELTTPYRFYQFWMNQDDADVGRLLRWFTMMTQAEIRALDATRSANPELRESQRALALEITRRVHGVAQAAAAVEVSELLFGGRDARMLSADALAALRKEVPFTSVVPDRESADDGNGASHALADVLTLFVEAKLAASRGAAKRLIEQGGVYVNGGRRTAADRSVTDRDLLPGRHVLLRKGVRDYALVHIESRD